jgi:beta-phosphoglucomutase family hydrolase
MYNCASLDDNRPWPLGWDLADYDALLFDLDGTLVDTMPLHCQAYADVFAARGYRFTMQDYLDNVGPPAAITIPAFVAAVGMAAIDEPGVKRIHQEKKQRFREILETGQLPILPTSALIEAHHARKPMAVVSSGNRDGVEAILRAAGWIDLFGCIVTGDDVTQGKPHPEPFLRAAQALGVAPGRCMVFEDTQSGIDGALAAGMSVIDVTAPGAVMHGRGAQ